MTLKRLIIILGLLSATYLMTGCVSLGFHCRKLSEMRESDYQYAVDLAKKVQLKTLRPQDMVTRLKMRYRKQEQEED